MSNLLSKGEGAKLKIMDFMEGEKIMVAVGRNPSRTGTTVLLIMIGAALGTLVGFGLEKYGIFAPFLRPAVIDIPSHTYVDFFFLSLSFGLRISITMATVLGALGGYLLSRKV